MDWFAPLVGFLIVSIITPGPNNILLAASGIRFGMRRTIPHVVGIHLGMYTLAVLCGLGLGQMLNSVPALLIAMKIFATGYLVYLAWKILGFEFQGDADVGSPMRVSEAWLFQFTNPKAWMMVTTGLSITITINQDMMVAVVVLCLGFISLGAVINFGWVYMGTAINSLLREEKYLRWVNWGLSAMTLLTIILFWAQ